MDVIYIIILTIILIIVLLKLYIKNVTKWCTSKVSLVGKTVIVTGANAGIGYETALELAKRGARVIVACRDEQRGSKAVESIKRLTENDNVELKLVDLASFKSIRNFVENITQNEEKIDILINNAGAYALGKNLSEDGLQVQWQINYFGPVLLSLLLLDLIKKSANSRIINVSSTAAQYATLTPTNLNQLNAHDNNMSVYCNSKLANILFTKKLAKIVKSSNVSVFSLHPGAIATELTRRWARTLRPIGDIIVNLFFLTPEEGAQTNIYAACEQNIEHLSGSHFERCKVIKPYKNTQNPDFIEQVWSETLKLINLIK